MRGERSISADDQAHRFVASYTYDLPWGPGRAWLNSNSFWAKTFGSWQVGGIALLRSGLPFGMDSTPTPQIHRADGSAPTGSAMAP